jgi:general secretion pathway protein E
MHTPDNLDLNRLLEALLAEQHLHASDALQVLEHAAAHPAPPAGTDCRLPWNPSTQATLGLDSLCRWLAIRLASRSCASTRCRSTWPASAT